MTRAELEDTIRGQFTRVVANALIAGTPSNGILNRATEAILQAADEYAATQALVDVSAEFKDGA